MTNTVKPYQNEFQTWAQVLPLFKVGTIYKFTPKYAEWLEQENKFIPDRPGCKKRFVGLFKLTAITGEGKYQADFEFDSLDGKPVFPNHSFIQVASEVYEEKDLDLMVDLGEIGL